MDIPDFLQGYGDAGVLLAVGAYLYRQMAEERRALLQIVLDRKDEEIRLAAERESDIRASLQAILDIVRDRK